MSQKVNTAILDIYKRYGEKTANDCIYDCLKYGNADVFKNSGINPENAQYELIKTYVESLVNDVPKDLTPSQYAILMTYQDYENEARKGEYGNLTKEQIQTGVLNSVANNVYRYLNNEVGVEAFTRKNNARKIFEDYKSNLAKSKISEKDEMIEYMSNHLTGSVKFKSRIKTKVNNLKSIFRKLDQRTIERNGKIFSRSSAANIENYMFAYQDIGNKKNHQEDACMIIQSEKYPNQKMLIVADGVSSSRNGDKAGQYIVDTFKNWFENIGKYDTKDYKTAQKLQNEIEKINSDLYDKYDGGAQSTLVCALIDKKGLLVSNVGDSKAYMMKENQLFELTKDDSVAEMDYNNEYKGKVEHSDMRFYKDSNIIMKAMGQQGKVNAKPWYLSSEDYDQIFLCSDGVSDCIGKEGIYALNKSCKPNELCRNSVKYALSHDSYLPAYLRGNDDFYGRIPAGKDNATGISYYKKADPYNYERCVGE